MPEEGALEPAFRLWAQVVSRPSAEQAFVNAGKRDAAYDLDLPLAQVVRRDGTELPATGIEVTGLSDQHAWLRTGPGRIWRWATGSASACRTRARRSTSGR